MNDFSNMVWVESRKALRSRMPLWTALGSLFMPLGVAFLLFVARNPDISQKLGLVSAKANLVAYAATDWQTYMTVYGEIIGAGGFILFILIISWVFGREFGDGTVKDLLAVPIGRATILLAKFSVAGIWSGGTAALIFCAGLIMGALLKLPGGSLAVVLQGSALALKTTCLVLMVVPPFAFFASAGRGYLLPIGVAMLTMMMMNLALILGLGEYFPWAVPVIFAQGKIPLPPASFLLVILSGLGGMAATYLWWMYADQNR